MEDVEDPAAGRMASQFVFWGPLELEAVGRDGKGDAEALLLFLPLLPDGAAEPQLLWRLTAEREDWAVELFSLSTRLPLPLPPPNDGPLGPGKVG